jgi:hypothetical protein
MLSFSVSKTFSRVTEESAEHGDAEEHGFCFEDETLSLAELLDELRLYSHLSSTVVSDHYAPWAVSEAQKDFRSGDWTHYGLHIHAISGKRPKAHQLRRIFKLANLA